jgi:predicted TIM-barrel fold metal-dependent hydrolase
MPMRRCASTRPWPLVRGVRCKPRISRAPDHSVRGEPGTLQDEALARRPRPLRAHDLLWDVRVPYWHLEEAAEAIARFPGLAGGGRTRRPAVGPQRRGPGDLAARHDRAGALPDVHVKLSEFGLPDAPWDAASTVRVVRETVEIFGAGRCMFASNLPVSGLRASMAEVVRTVAEALDALDADARDAIWCGNALRFYRISLPAR